MFCRPVLENRQTDAPAIMAGTAMPKG